MNKSILLNFLTIFLPLSFIYALFAYVNLNVVTDYFHLNKIIDARSFIATILGTLSTIISITVALVILSFNSFKDKANDYAIEYFVSIKSLHYLVALYITGIFLIFLSLIEVSKQPNTNKLNLLYFNLFLFASCLVLMVTFSYHLFKKVSISGLIQYYFSKINKHQIAKSKIINLDLSTIQQKFADPLFILEDLGLKYIRKGDFFISNIIFLQLNYHFSEFLSEAKDSKEVDQYLAYSIKMHQNIIPELILKNNVVLLSEIWNAFKIFHSKINNEMKFSFSFWAYFNYFGCLYYQALIHANKHELANQFFDTILWLFPSDLSKMFPHERELHSFSRFFKDEYKNLYGNSNHEGFLEEINEDWRNYIEIISSIYYSCAEFALKENNEKALLKIIAYITKYTTFNVHNPQPLKALYVYRKFYPVIKELLERGFDRKIINNDIGELITMLNPLRNLHTRIKIAYENHILTEYGNLLIFLQKYNLIDHAIVGGLTAGDLLFTGEIGELTYRYIYPFKDNEIHYDCLTTIFEIITVLSDQFEIEIEKNKRFYFQLRERLLYLDDELNKQSHLPEKGNQLHGNIKVHLENMNTILNP
jgi:hypothetical protein